MHKNLIIIMALLFWTPIFYVVILKWIYPPITITQADSWLKFHKLERHYVNLDEISEYASLAAMSGEDKNFLKHHGFDITRICVSIIRSQQGGRPLQNTSTISQQTAKNVFLWQGRSWIRKGLEAYFTVLIEKIWGKKRILEIYLNVIEMGPGIFGIDAAAHHYFNRPAADLTPFEAAMIMASLPNPRRFTINPMSERVNMQAPWVLKGMAEMGAL